MGELSRVKAKVYDNGKSSTVEGDFHCWSNDHEEYDNGPGGFPVAIVELDSGEVITPMAKDVTFIDKNYVICEYNGNCKETDCEHMFKHIITNRCTGEYCSQCDDVVNCVSV